MAWHGTEPNIKEAIPSYVKVWKTGKCVRRWCKVGKVFAGDELGGENVAKRITLSPCRCLVSIIARI
uniref:Uncharacterized protein n=1 Tax=Romanomermis culicivorax TaxID=13658 RepID=A0A915JC80_ROMCU